MNNELSQNTEQFDADLQDRNIDTIQELSEFLTEVKENENSDTALAHALNAQLQVLNAINSPSLSCSVYDLMLDSLKKAVEKAKSPEEKKEYQRSAAIMTNSMVFFMEAKLHWEENKWSKTGQELLKNACNLVAESSVALLKIKTGSVILSSDLGIEMFENLMSNVGGFFSKVVDWFAKWGQIEQYEREFYKFLLNLSEKMHKYHDIYGNQALLGELLLRYKNELVKNSNDKTEELRELNPNNSALIIKPFKDKTLMIKNILIVLLSLSSLFNVFLIFNWIGGDSWLESFSDSNLFNPLFNFHFGFLGIHFLLKLIIIGLPMILPITGLKKLGAIKEYEVNKYRSLEANQKYKIKEQYFIELAKMYRY